MSLQAKTIAIIGGFVVYAYGTYANYDKIVEAIQNSNVLVAILLYILFNPAYLLIIYGIFRGYRHRRAWKRIIASIMVILSLDFLAVPRLHITDSLTNGAATTTNIGSIIMRALEIIFPHNMAYWMMYLLLPILGVLISIELLGISNFIKEHMNKGV